MMRQWFCLSFLFLAVCSVLSVNRDNFKTCKQSSFCSRQRDVKPDEILYSVVPDSIRWNSLEFVANLSRANGNQTLTFCVTYLAFSTFRITIDEPSSQPARYKLGPNEALRETPERLSFKFVKSSDSVSLIGSAEDKMVINMNPFSINFYLADVMVTQLNRRHLFNFEEQAEPPSSKGYPNPEPEAKSNPTTEDDIEPSQESHSNPSHDDVVGDAPDFLQESNPSDGVERQHEVPVESSEASSEDPSVHDVTTDEAKSDTVPNDPFPWAEHFKEHKDTRPFGPTSFSMDVDFPGFSHLFGLPEHTDGFVLRSTDGKDPYRLYNVDIFEYELNSVMALYGAVPLVWALNENYTIGVFWHNPSETWIDVGYTDRPTNGFLSKLPRLFAKPQERYSTTRWISESGVLDVFVMLGREPLQISKAYSQLTGATPLPPLFSLGYHQSRWNYKDQADVLSIDANFDEHGIPLDVIWLDIEHTNGKRYFTWDKSNFPSPGEMVDKLLIKDRKLVTVVDPHIKQDLGWNLYKEGVDKKYFIQTRDGSDFIGWCWPGSSAWPDFTNPRIRRWWAEQFLTYDPVRADTMFSWNDMGEPSVFSGPEVTMNKDAIHEGNREHRDVHNIYGLHVHQSTWEGQLLRSSGRERPFVLTRAFFAGSQRTAAVWTGDNTADWGHLEATVPMVLSLSLCAITFSGADVGGFFGNTEPELLVRWYQAGAYQPFFRSHKHMDTKRHEPWTLPKEYTEIVRQSIVERYRLLPYWYTAFAVAEFDGRPVMAPLWYYFRHVASLYDVQHVYMIGEAILVAPVTSQGASYVDIPLPPGVWYHHTSLESFTGDSQIRFPVTLSVTPVFYRGGWIIPRRDRIRRSSGLMRSDPFTLFIMLDPNLDECHGYLYDDDYHSTGRETARLYKFEFQASHAPAGKGISGGRLRIRHLPSPGKTVAPAEQHIERMVFVGLSHPLTRVTVLRDSGDRQNLDFTQVPTHLADSRYMGIRNDGVAVVNCFNLSLSSDWELHLVSGMELKNEL